MKNAPITKATGTKPTSTKISQVFMPLAYRNSLAQWADEIARQGRQR